MSSKLPRLDALSLSLPLHTIILTKLLTFRSLLIRFEFPQNVCSCCAGSADSGDTVVLYMGGQTFICLQPPVSPAWSEVSTVLYEDPDMKDVC